MENNQISKPLQNFNVSAEIKMAESGLLILDAEEEQIKQTLRYVFILLGLNAKNIPEGIAKTVLLNFIKKVLWKTTLEEIKLAFELAVAKKIKVDLDLYGETFSAKSIMETVKEYEDYKKANAIKLEIDPEVPRNNFQRVTKITELLTPETIEKLKELGKEEIKQKPKLNRGHDVFQKWMALFDKLKRNYEVPDTNGRFIKRYGLILNLEAFINYKTAQLSIVTAYLNDRNNDVL